MVPGGPRDWTLDDPMPVEVGSLRSAKLVGPPNHDQFYHQFQ